MGTGEHGQTSREFPDRLRVWELVTFTLLLFVATVYGVASWALWYMETVSPPDCGFLDLECELASLETSFILGAVAAVIVTPLVVRRWRRRSPGRVLAWVVVGAALTAASISVIVVSTLTD